MADHPGFIRLQRRNQTRNMQDFGKIIPVFALCFIPCKVLGPNET